MDVASLLTELYGRIPPLARAAVEGAGADRLVEAPAPGANTIAWLVWHIARVQDHHVAEILETEQLWIADSWASRFGMDPDPSNIGYGHTEQEAASIRPGDPDVLLDYLFAVQGRTDSMLQRLVDADLDRVVDDRWDPSVTLGVRLISIADDSLQHVGQASYVRGLLDGAH